MFEDQFRPSRSFIDKEEGVERSRKERMPSDGYRRSASVQSRNVRLCIRRRVVLDRRQRTARQSHQKVGLLKDPDMCLRRLRIRSRLRDKLLRQHRTVPYRYLQDMTLGSPRFCR